MTSFFPEHPYLPRFHGILHEKASTFRFFAEGRFLIVHSGESTFRCENLGWFNRTHVRVTPDRSRVCVASAMQSINWLIQRDLRSEFVALGSAAGVTLR
jgi:hypothetical protein